MKIVLTCGGTAGHINPAIAVAQRLNELIPDCEILFMGAEGKMEMDLVPRDGFRILPLKVTNLSRGHHLEDVGHNLVSLKNVIDACREAKRILKEFQPDAVLGTGGYVCYPVLHEASKLHIPTLIHESNALPGLTTKMLANTVSCVMLGYHESARHYPGVTDLRVTGTPVRGKFCMYTREKAREELGIAPDIPLVVSMWGSLGSGHMNDIIVKMLPLMKGQKEFRMVHAIGSRDLESVQEKLRQQELDPALCNVDAREYIYDTPRCLAAADLVLCRAGASTLAELTYLGKPVLIVPSPNVTDNHQEKNARVLEKAGGARVFLEGEFDAPSLLQTVKELLADRETLSRMSEAMSALSVPDATDQICSIILGLTEG